MVEDEEDALLPETGPSDEELFAEVMDQEEMHVPASVVFRREAQHRLSQVNDSAFHVGDRQYAEERGVEYMDLVCDLLDIAAELHQKETDKSSRFFIALKAQRIAMSALDLVSQATALRDPGKRGDLLDFGREMTDAAFFIGRWEGNLSPDEIAALEKAAHAKAGGSGGRKGSPTRTSASQRWKTWVEAEVRRMLRANPGLRAEELASKTEQMTWPAPLGEPRERRTVLDHIRQINRRQTPQESDWLDAPEDPKPT